MRDQIHSQTENTISMENSNEFNRSNEQQRTRIFDHYDPNMGNPLGQIYGQNED